MLDCDLSEVFVSSADYPDWSSCLSFKNQSDECGKEELKDQREYPRLYSPVKAYQRIVTKNHWVRKIFQFFQLLPWKIVVLVSKYNNDDCLLNKTC